MPETPPVLTLADLDNLLGAATTLYALLATPGAPEHYAGCDGTGPRCTRGCLDVRFVRDDLTRLVAEARAARLARPPTRR